MENIIKVINYPNLRIEKLKGKEVVKEMQKVRELMKMNMPNGYWWFSAGSALGIVREPKLFIEHDTDIDLEVFVKKPYYVEFLKMTMKDYMLVREMYCGDRVMQLAYMNNEDIIIDFYFYYDKEKDFIVNHNDGGTLRVPKKYIENMEEVRGFVVPTPVKEYLKYRYGSDWATPINNKKGWDYAGEALERK